MNPVLLGIVLGIANVVANAILFGLVGPEPRGAGMVLVYGLLPGICTGSLLGAIAGGTREWSRTARLVIVGAPSALVVVFLGGAFRFEQFVPYSLVPTLACCFVLETTTRSKPRTVEDPPPPGDGIIAAPPRRSAVKLAMGLGAVVMLVAMVGIDAMATRPGWHGFAEAYIPWGLLLGLGLSAPFGMVAEYTIGWRVWARRAALLACAFGLTAFLATLARLEDMIVISFIPVAAACMLLERYSRPDPTVPVATVGR